jgi:hypothetical protein
MKFLKVSIFLVLIPLLSFKGIHKYYISVTQINFVEDQQSVQIVSRIFIDDFENLLRQRYDENITLAGNNESKMVEQYMERYLKEKIIIKINNELSDIVFIGREYESDIVKCYMEVENIKDISVFEISNKVLFDLYEDQQNIIKTKINLKQKSFILSSQKNSVLLKFD